MKHFQTVLVLVLTLVVVACEGTIQYGDSSQVQLVAPGAGSAPGGKADSFSTPADGGGALDGAALYQQHCASCHGIDATGGASFPNSIVGFTPIDDIVKNGTGVMPAIAVDDAEVAAIQTFLTGDDVETSEPTPAVDETSSGLEVFAAKCAACHGSEGEGAAQGPVIRLRVPDFVEFAVREGRNGAGNPSTMPAFDHGEVTEPQLEEMTAWLDAFPNPTTGEGLYNQYCAACHGDNGHGGTSSKPVAGLGRIGSIIREGHNQGRYEERTEYMPGWTQEQLSDAEVALIEGYLRSM